MRRRQTVWVLPSLLGCLELACVSEEPSKEPPAEVQKLIVDKAPDNITPLNVNFDDKITLIGATLEPGLEVAPGKRVKVTMYWRADKPLDDPEWKLFTHILDGSGDRLMNIDNVGPLRQGGKNVQAWPPGRWAAGKVYVDTQTFTVPKKVKSSKIQVVAGVWKGKDRLPLRSGPSVSDDRALVATLTTTKAAPKPERSVPELEVVRLTKGTSIRIDGKFDDAAWKDASATPAFVNVTSGNPDEDSPVQGSAKLLWDDKALYLSISVKDEDVEGGFDKAAKDPHLWTKDCVEIMIDPEGDGDNKDYYEIQINPQNLVFDSRFDEYNKPRVEPNGPFGNQDWSAKLESAVSIQGTLDNDEDEDEGYGVEARIPWSSFDKAKAVPPKAGDAWRMNLYAMHENSGVAWSPILSQGNFHRATRFARVRWVDEKSQPPIAGKGPEKLAPPAAAAAKTASGAPGAEAPGTASGSAGAAAKPPARDVVVQKKALQGAPAPATSAPAAPPSPAPPSAVPRATTAPASAPETTP